MSDAPTPQVNPVVGMLGAQWSVSPVGWSWIKAGGPNGDFHLLVVETPIGRIGLAFSDEDLGQFLRTAQLQHTGLVVPKPGEVLL